MNSKQAWLSEVVALVFLIEIGIFTILFRGFANTPSPVSAKSVATGILEAEQTPAPVTDAEVLSKFQVDTVDIDSQDFCFDFKLLNRGDVPIRIYRVLFKVLDFDIGDMEVSGDMVSDNPELYFDISFRSGSFLKTTPNMIVDPGTDRLKVHLKWRGAIPIGACWYIIVPALQTSYGIKRCEAKKLCFRSFYMDQRALEGDPLLNKRFSKRKSKQIFEPQLMSTEEADKTPIDWEAELAR